MVHGISSPLSGYAWFGVVAGIETWSVVEAFEVSVASNVPAPPTGHAAVPQLKWPWNPLKAL